MHNQQHNDGSWDASETNIDWFESQLAPRLSDEYDWARAQETMDVAQRVRERIELQRNEKRDARPAKNYRKTASWLVAACVALAVAAAPLYWLATPRTDDLATGLAATHPSTVSLSRRLPAPSPQGLASQKTKPGDRSESPLKPAGPEEGVALLDAGFSEVASLYANRNKSMSVFIDRLAGTRGGPPQHEKREASTSSREEAKGEERLIANLAASFLGSDLAFE